MSQMKVHMIPTTSNVSNVMGALRVFRLGDSRRKVNHESSSGLDHLSLIESMGIGFERALKSFFTVLGTGKLLTAAFARISLCYSGSC